MGKKSKLQRTSLLVAAMALSAGFGIGVVGTLEASGDPTQAAPTYTAEQVSDLFVAISADATFVETSSQGAITLCMAAKGFTYVVGDRSNGMTESGKPIEGWQLAMRGTTRIEYSGLFGLRGSVPGDGCVADARAAVAGSDEAYVALVVARDDIGSIVAAAAKKAQQDGVDMHEILGSGTAQQQLRDLVARWEVARVGLPLR